MDEFLIRAAEVADAPAIAEVHTASWAAAYSGLLSPEVLDAAQNVEERTERWRRSIPLIGDEGHRTWVAEASETIVGFAYSQPTEDEDLNPLEIAEVVALYLAPEHFGRGLGKRLLDKAVAGVRSQGFLQATLWVLEENARAIRFYRREGWRPDGTRAPCFRVFNAPALRMRLPL